MAVHNINSCSKIIFSYFISLPCHAGILIIFTVLVLVAQKMDSGIHIDKAIYCVIQWIVLFSLEQLVWPQQQGSLRVAGASQEERVHTKPEGQNNVRLLFLVQGKILYYIVFIQISTAALIKFSRP